MSVKGIQLTDLFQINLKIFIKLQEAMVWFQKCCATTTYNPIIVDITSQLAISVFLELMFTLLFVVYSV